MTKKNILKIAFIYTATILGAGFATGKELVSFFGIFGKTGIFGFFISSLLLSISCISILDIIFKTSTSDYEDFMRKIFGRRLGKFVEIFNLIFLFILFFAMIAGGGETLATILNINQNVASIVFLVAVFFSLIYGKKAIIHINTVLAPILIVGIILIGIYISFSVQPVFNTGTKPILSSFVYTSYNAITTISVLYSVKNIVTSRKVVIWGGTMGGLFIFFIGICMLIPLTMNYDIIKNESLPILYLLSNEDYIKWIYTIVVLLAIFTTAISDGVALEEAMGSKFKNSGLTNISLKFFILIGGYVFSIFGFSSFVDKVYPIFGYLGLFEIAVIFIMFLFKSIDK